MKNLKVFFAGITLLWLASCSLDETILDTPNPKQVKTEKDLIPLVKGLYARLNDGGAFKYRGWLMLTLAADDFYSTAIGDFSPLAQRAYTSSHVSPFYSNLFLTVGAANELIEVLDNIGAGLDSATVSRSYGEAYFIRAFSYYYLVRLYGGVPLRLRATNVDSELYLPRAGIEEVYAQIFKDFKEASLRLPLASRLASADLGRATKGAAQAILAQAYLTYGNQLSLKSLDPSAQYSNAILYADSVITSSQYSLITNYADLFDISKETAAYKEVIFGIRFQPDIQQVLLPSAGSEFAFRFGAPNTHKVCGNPSNGAGDGSIRPMHWIADFYRTGDFGNLANSVKDYRNEVAFMQTGYQSIENKYYATYPNIPATGQGAIITPLLGKYIDPNGRDQRNNGNDFFVIRFAEVYLIRAEAENELNGPDAAFSYFNATRNRARLADGTARPRPLLVNRTYNPAITKAELRMKIFEERGIELIGEGQRWFDLVRMQHPSNPAKTMYEYQLMEELAKAIYPKTFPTYNTTTKLYSNSSAVYRDALNVSVPKFLLFPIPVEETIRNPNFGEQNPGW